MSKYVSIEAVETAPKDLFDLDDVQIVAEHYGYDFASCFVKNCGFNKKLTAHVGFCLVENGKLVWELPNWRKDEVLVKKLYLHDEKYGFIASCVSFEDYFRRISRLAE